MKRSITCLLTFVLATSCYAQPSCSGPQYTPGSSACEFVYPWALSQTPLRIQLAVGETPPGAMELRSDLPVPAMAVAFSLMPPVRACAGALPVGTDLLALNLADPSFGLLFGGTFLGGQTGSVISPIPTGAPVDISIQGVALDPSVPSGLRLSQGAVISVEIPNLTSVKSLRPKAVAAARRLALNRGNFASMAAIDVYGQHDVAWISRKGVIQLGGAVYTGPAGVPTPADLLTGRPKVVLGGNWIYPTGTITAKALHDDGILIGIAGAFSPNDNTYIVHAGASFETGRRVTLTGLLEGLPTTATLIGMGPGNGAVDMGDQRAIWEALAAQGGGVLVYPQNAAVYSMGKPAGVSRIEFQVQNALIVTVDGAEQTTDIRAYDLLRGMMENVAGWNVSPTTMVALMVPLKAAEAATLAGNQATAQARMAIFAAAVNIHATEINSSALDLSFLNEPWVKTRSASYVAAAANFVLIPPNIDWFRDRIAHFPVSEETCVARCFGDFIECVGDFTGEEIAFLYMCLSSEWNFGSGDASDIMWRVLACFDRTYPGHDWDPMCIRDLYACINACI